MLKWHSCHLRKFCIELRFVLFTDPSLTSDIFSSCFRPRQLYFGCLQESKSKGGETSLCDFRKVYQEMDPEVRQKFEDKKVLYNRTHPRVGERWTFDVGAMLSWQQMFGTSDMKEVETICQEEDAPKVSRVTSSVTTGSVSLFCRTSGYLTLQLISGSMDRSQQRYLPPRMD